MAASACDLSQWHQWRIVFFSRYFSGSLVHLPEENLSKQSSLSSVGCEPRQKSLPLRVEERSAGTTAFKVTQLGCFFIRKISNRGCDEGLLLSFLIRGEFFWIDHLSHVRIPRLFELSLFTLWPFQVRGIRLELYDFFVVSLLLYHYCYFIWWKVVTFFSENQSTKVLIDFWCRHWNLSCQIVVALPRCSLPRYRKQVSLLAVKLNRYIRVLIVFCETERP